jgi:hypothetical protein
MQGRVDDAVRRLLAVAEYHELRTFLRGPGAALLPAHVTADALFDVLDRNPTGVAEVLLGLPVRE